MGDKVTTVETPEAPLEEDPDEGVEGVEIRQITIPETQQGSRLDRSLAEYWSDLSRSRLQRLIREGQVWLNGNPCLDKNRTLQAGDQIEVRIPAATPLTLQPEWIPLEILYEDADLIVINKPRDLVVHPAPGHSSGTLVHALLAHCPNLSGINGAQRPGIVHRLDKDTTGALVIAKQDQAHQHLQAQIQAKTARRIYLGVVLGRPAQSHGTLSAPIGRHPVDRQKMAVVEPPKGRAAVTHWQVLERLGNYSLMQFELETGRTHQIRVHAAHLRLPIVGDPLYTQSKSSPVKLRGQALHAWKLSFVHPRSGQPMQFTAPLPEEFERLLRQLRSQAG
ncbi:RluA family pseudouridine synthase [Synechococcus bigranulatus str. 'Rupite']|uniref:Pseudouridine synthase n=1 Tax=Thermostichus vulcanus str. 'Rupite' TaxID=2813851 RepID=A0ABT0CAD0_THEVL|nr:RluA family pseudouridine synthase [Thermostichus vulcanus]MCJ2542669.1 RluA family pseudouridine synthase [Thermostichus vulcanus str. 'Rupite']